MIKKIIVSLCVILMAVITPMIPAWIRDNISKVCLITPESIEFCDIVNANGVIEDMNKQEIFIDSPIIPTNIRVSVGDYVEKGDLLFNIDKNATINAAVSGNVSAINIPEEYSSYITPELIQEVIKNNTEQLQNNMPEKINNMPDSVYSPESGIVTDVKIREKNISTPTEAMITISNFDNLTARLYVTEDNINNVAVGQKVSIKGVGWGNEKLTGYIVKIYPVTQKIISSLAEENAVDVIVSLDKTIDKLKIGFTVEAEISIAPPRQILTIPYEAIRQDQDNREYVFTVKNGRTQKQYITTGIEFVNGVEVIDGINKNDCFIENSDSLTEKQLVIVENPA